MKMITVALAVIVCVAASMFIAPQASAASGGTADATYWDFGKVKAGQILRHTFSVENKSDTTLRITEVNTSCYCCTARMSDRTLKPGESAELRVKFDTKKFTGENRKQIYVNTDSKANAVIVYEIRAYIEGR